MQITVSTTKSFIEYIKSQPIVFEVFGHYQQHPLHKDAKLEGNVRQPPRRMLPLSIPISQPVRSSKFGALPSPCTAHIHAKIDVLVWFEICELAPNGEYVPVVVEHSDDFPCRGLFLLHQVSYLQSTNQRETYFLYNSFVNNSEHFVLTFPHVEN